MIRKSASIYMLCLHVFFLLGEKITPGSGQAEEGTAGGRPTSTGSGTRPAGGGRF